MLVGANRHVLVLSNQAITLSIQRLFGIKRIVWNKKDCLRDKNKYFYPHWSGQCRGTPSDLSGLYLDSIWTLSGLFLDPIWTLSEPYPSPIRIQKFDLIYNWMYNLNVIITKITSKYSSFPSFFMPSCSLFKGDFASFSLVVHSLPSRPTLFYYC